MKSINLANPCSENWGKMQPVAQGRLCGHCQTQVHDMTALSTQEVIELFQKNGGKLCGRLTESQLKQHNESIEKQSFFRFSKITKSISAFSVVAMAFLTMPLKKSYAKFHVEVTQPNTFSEASNRLPEAQLDSSRIVKVRVVDERGNAINGAEITLLNAFKKELHSIKTNEEGNGIMNIPTDYCSIKITFFDKKEIIYSLTPTSDSILIKMKENCDLEEVIMFLGYMNSNSQTKKNNSNAPSPIKPIKK